MTFIDDNFLDSIITRLTREHRDILMATAKRLNLPDDDVLFLYIGAIEYTVQLCEDVLGGIKQERQSIEQSVKDTQAASISQAEAIIKHLIQVAKVATADIKTSGMATTSAIAEANSEVLSKSKETVVEAQALKDQLTDLLTSVNADRQTNKDVLEGLIGRIGQSTKGLETAISQINSSHTALNQLQQNTKWLKVAEWFSPLTALGIAAVAGAAVWGWGLHMYWGESEKYLSVIKNNQAQFDKCFNTDGLMKPGLDCKIWYQKDKKAKK